MSLDVRGLLNPVMNSGVSHLKVKQYKSFYSTTCHYHLVCVCVCVCVFCMCFLRPEMTLIYYIHINY